MKTPAVTIVAAWINAETGVGPSIASGSQVCSGICADFPIAPMNSRMQARVSESTCQPRNSIVVPTALGAAPKTVPKSSEPKITKTAYMPSENPKSPTRLTRNALIAAALAEGRSYQKPIKQIGHQADAFPAEEQLHEVVGRHQCQHEKGEQAQIGHEARDRRIPVHVADRIDVDHRRDDGHDEDHDAAQRVEPQRPGDIDTAGDDPARQRDDPRAVAGEDVAEQKNAEHRRQQKGAAGDQLRAPIADHPAKEAGDDRGEKRQENDGDGQGISLSSC